MYEVGKEMKETCCLEQHNYVFGTESYYFKHDEHGNGITEIGYRILVCLYCGDTKEVIVKNQKC